MIKTVLKEYFEEGKAREGKYLLGECEEIMLDEVKDINYR